MEDGIELADKLLGLCGVRVLEVEEQPGKLVVTAETTRARRCCPSCRRRAQRSRRSQGLPYAAAWALHYSAHDRDRRCPEKLRPGERCPRPRQPTRGSTSK